jgi:hypothetical protein
LASNGASWRCRFSVCSQLSWHAFNFLGLWPLLPTQRRMGHITDEGGVNTFPVFSTFFDVGTCVDYKTRICGLTAPAGDRILHSVVYTFEWHLFIDISLLKCLDACVDHLCGKFRAAQPSIGSLGPPLVCPHLNYHFLRLPLRVSWGQVNPLGSKLPRATRNLWVEPLGSPSIHRLSAVSSALRDLSSQYGDLKGVSSASDWGVRNGRHPTPFPRGENHVAIIRLCRCCDNGAT